MKKIILITLILTTLNIFAIDKVYYTDTLPKELTSYDKKANPHEALSKAMQKAKKSGKKILLIVGGDWCKWCGAMDNFFDDHEEIARDFYGSFEIVRVYYGKDISKEGKSLLIQFPPLKGTPHFYILDSNAKLLKSVDTAYMERGYGYHRKKVIEFINQNAKVNIKKEK